MTFSYFHFSSVPLGFAFYFSLLVFRFASSSTLVSRRSFQHSVLSTFYFASFLPLLQFSAFVSRPPFSAFDPFHLLLRVLSAFVAVLGNRFAPALFSIRFFSLRILAALFQFSSVFVSGPLFWYSVQVLSSFVSRPLQFSCRGCSFQHSLRSFLLLFAFVSRPPFAFLLDFVSRSHLSAFGSRTFRFLLEYLFSIHSVPVDFASFAALVRRLIAHVYSKQKRSSKIVCGRGCGNGTLPRKRTRMENNECFTSEYKEVLKHCLLHRKGIGRF